jgi:hypothetical protein
MDIQLGKLKGGDLPKNNMKAIISLKNTLISELFVDYPRQHMFTK